MKPGLFFWKAFAGCAAMLGGIVLLCVGWTASRLDETQIQQLVRDLESQAILIRGAVEGRFDAPHVPELRVMLSKIREDDPEGPRVTLIEADGDVLADSHADAANMEPHGSRPEVVQALREGRGRSTRFSKTVNRSMGYVALRIGPAEAPAGVVRVALPVQTMEDRIETLHGLLWTLGFSVLGSSLLIALGLAAWWRRRLHRITQVARNLARGDWVSSIPSEGKDELALLSRSLEKMRDRLVAQISSIDGERKTLGLLLDRLSDGVVVARSDGRIVLVNTAAGRLLGIPETRVNEGTGESDRTIESCIPNHQLQQMLLVTPDSREAPDSENQRGHSHDDDRPLEEQVELQTAHGSFSILARVSRVALPTTHDDGGALYPGVSREDGRLMVMSDITELSRAIRSRTDFVANASHELRTPVAAIKGAVETLLSMDLADDAEQAPRFLTMIQRHVHRIESMLKDLLELSRVESMGGPSESGCLLLQPILDEMHSRFAPLLDQKRIQWTADLPPDCSFVWANAYLLQLALDNLVDNAIKFTKVGGKIAVSCRRNGDSVTIEVADSGCGISLADQPRVFERFFQVEPSRSTAFGKVQESRGTGLGLSIVKHALAAMGGSVNLVSEVGIGSRFTISVPACSPNRVLHDSLNSNR